MGVVWEQVAVAGTSRTPRSALPTFPLCMYHTCRMYCMYCRKLSGTSRPLGAPGPPRPCLTTTALWWTPAPATPWRCLRRECGQEIRLSGWLSGLAWLACWLASCDQGCPAYHALLYASHEELTISHSRTATVTAAPRPPLGGLAPRLLSATSTARASIHPSIHPSTHPPAAARRGFKTRLSVPTLRLWAADELVMGEPARGSDCNPGLPAPSPARPLACPPACLPPSIRRSHEGVFGCLLFPSTLPACMPACMHAAQSPNHTPNPSRLPAAAARYRAVR